MKHKLLLALLALFTLGGSNLQAQTDVTDQYITNAGFDNCTAETSDVAAKTIKDYSSNGWTKVNSGDFTTLAVTAYGSGVKVGVSTTPGSKKDGTTVSGNTLGIIAGWADNVTIQSGEITLPAGVYTLTVDHYLTSSTSNYGSNSSKFGFVTSSNSYLVSSTTFSASTWTTETVTFTLSESTTGKIQIGLTGLNTSGSGSPAVFYDDVTITWTDPLQAAKDALQAEIEKATSYNTELQNSDLTQAIATAQETKNIATTETELTTAIETLKAAVITALTETDGAVTTTTDLFVVNPSFETGQLSPWTANNANDTGVKPNSNGTYTTNGVDGDYLFNTWGGTAEKYVKQTLTGLPEGYYTITASVASDAGNKVTLFAGSAQVEQKVSADGKGQFVDGTTPKTYVAADGSLEIGAKSTNWYKVDNFRLTYYTVTAGAREAWLAAKAAAEAAIADEAYDNVTGNERTTLQAEIDKEEPTTAEAYGEATTALQNATASFKNAKAAYDAFVAASDIEMPSLAYVSEEKRQQLDEALSAEPNTAAEAETATAKITTALRAYYESHALAEGVEGAVNMTDKITNANNPTNNDGWTWTGSKNNPASNEPWTDAEGTNTHSYFDGGNWNASSWTTTMKQTVNVPAGKYLLTAKARAAVGVTFTMAVGEASVDLPHIGSTGNVFDRGWGDASVEFETDGSGAEIVVTASSNTIHEWFSISNFRLVQLEAITVPMADANDYATLASAITTAEANTLGFDADEYAPYNNVAALQALAAAKAINPEAEDGNTKEVVQNATTALTTATWTANTEEVDAIFDGQFAKTEALSETGKVVLPGWTKVDGIRLLVKDETVDPGLAYTDGKAAVFSWGGTTLTYGEQAGYTLPMNKYSIYELTFKVSGWRDGDMPSYISVELDGIKQEINNPEVKAINSTDGNPFATLKFYVTPSNDNSTLKIYANHHFTIADLSMKLANAIRLTDEAEVVPETTTNEVTVLYDRKLLSGWNSLVLPFDVTQDELGIDNTKDGERVLAYGGTTKNGDNDYTINFNDVEGDLSANTPYLIKKAADGNAMQFTGKIIEPAENLEAADANNAYTFVGTYIAKTAEDNFIKAGDLTVGASALKKATKAKAIKAFRAFLRVELSEEEAANAKISVNINGNEVDAIEAIEIMNAMSDGIYNLQGQKVSNAQKGIYIVNGKKILKK